MGIKKYVDQLVKQDDGTKTSFFTYYRILFMLKSFREIELYIYIYLNVCVFE